MDMEAVILAAGLGSRLRPYTNKVPKAMVPFKGTEIIKHQIETLISQDIEKITIVTGYKSKILYKFLNKTFPKLKFNFVENKKYYETNSAYSAMKVLSNISSSYIHINCDILFSKEVLNNLIKLPKKNVISARQDITLQDSMENIIEVEGRIVNMSLRKSKHAKFKAFGLAKISLDALHANINFFQALKNDVQRQENYFGLIRMNLGKIDYHLLETNKKHLSEINTVADLKNCKFSLKG